METNAFAYDVCRRYVGDNCSTLGDELTKRILGYVRSRNLKALCSLKSGGMHSHDASVIRCLMQIESFFKKNAAFSDGELCEHAAQVSFLDAEKQCRITNRRLDFYYTHLDRLDPDMREWMTRAERWIQLTLGSFDTFLEKIPSLVRLTSGATATRPRKRAAPQLKLKLSVPCSPGSVPYLKALYAYFGQNVIRCNTSPFNRVVTVPKNWKTRRTIACEQDGTLPFQLAFDSFAKDRLRLRGINLSDQFRNQEMSRLASITGSHATIDLSAASDTCAYNTVAWLFPEPWLKYLEAHRSTHYRSPFGEGKYAKFSSMGNGATFCIETLVFAAACYAVGSKDYSVYGDDIIIESELSGDLIRMLAFLGFTVNSDKSYITGPFRESCGSNWFEGVDVTPFHLDMASWRKPDLCHVVNGLAGIAHPDGQLEDLLVQTVREFKLPFVPYCESTNSGVWIDVYNCYNLGLIRVRNSVPRVKAYVSKTADIESFGTSALYLWYHDANRVSPHNQDENPDIGSSRLEPLVRSRYSTNDTKYVRKWICWTVCPAGSVPLYLSRWSDVVVRAQKP